MEPLHVVLILVAGVAVGWINNLAGAAGAIGLIAFEQLLGMDPMTANATLRPSALALATFGLIGFWSKGQKIPPRIWGYALLTVPGAIAGSLLVRPELTLLFQLTLAALLLLVLGQTLSNKPVVAEHSDTHRPSPLWLLLLLFSWLGAHMGFIQVATGLVSIFILSMVHSKDLVQVNAAKMVFVIVAALASNITLVARGTLTEWAPALTLAAGAAAGSFLASRWSVRKGHGAVRIVVIGICVVVLVRLGVQIFSR